MKQNHEFMSNLSAAILLQHNRVARFSLYCIAILVTTFIIWATHAELDQITRGAGRIVPSSKNQVLQNLEGGIVAEILIKNGDPVEKGQTLIKIDNKIFESNLEENQLKVEELQSRRARLEAEASGAPVVIDEQLKSKRADLVENEMKLLNKNRAVLENQIQMVKDQITQQNNLISSANTRISHLSKNKALLNEQITMTRPLVEKGIESKTNMINLERELISINQEISASSGHIRSAKNEIQELEKRIDELKINFKTRAQKELNDTIAHIDQINNRKVALSDQVFRTNIQSPVKGIVKQMFVNTPGGAVKPGMDLVEIVPVEDTLLVEAKILPQDIAFIAPDQKATIRVSAYDFSIYGGLEGKVVDISADTLTEANGMTYYLVRLKADKNSLGSAEKPLKLMPGMMVTVDILTGKKTVFDYLLKPFLKTKQVALTER